MLKKVTFFVLCFWIAASVGAKPMYFSMTDNTPRLDNYVQPQENVEFRILSNPSKTILKIDNEIYKADKIDACNMCAELSASKDSSLTMNDLSFSNASLSGFNSSNGRSFQSSNRGNLPGNSGISGSLNGGFNGDNDGDSSGATAYGKPPHSSGNSSSGLPAVPVPGAVILGCSGLILVSWLKRRQVIQ